MRVSEVCVQQHLSRSFCSKSLLPCSRRPVSIKQRCQAAEHGPSDATPSVTRRLMLVGGVLLSAGSTAQHGHAVDVDLETQLPGLPAPSKLPKAYVQTASKLGVALRDSIEAEASGASEREVRRKADPAKELVREFVGKWRNNPAVVDEESYAQLTQVITELGQFYKAAGPRSRLTGPARDSILAHIAAAEAALPPPEERKGLLGF